VIVMLVVCAVLALGGDQMRELARYDRAALGVGEYWRLVSGHLVHLGWGHLWPNLAALIVIALLLEGTFRSIDWVVIGLASAAAIDVGLLTVDTEVEWYVGLSGVLHGFVAGGALGLVLQRQALGAVLGIGVAAKLAFEQTFGPVPFTAASVGGPVIVSAHLFGAAGGLLAAAVLQVLRRRVSRL
jgi:rhomboid family GlyGly-CTERM serine protease